MDTQTLYIFNELGEDIQKGVDETLVAAKITFHQNTGEVTLVGTLSLPTNLGHSRFDSLFVPYRVRLVANRILFLREREKHRSSIVPQTLCHIERIIG